MSPGNEWDCQGNFQWVLTLHEQGVLLNGDSLTCHDAQHKESWIDLSYSIIKRENNKKVKKKDFIQAVTN